MAVTEELRIADIPDVEVDAVTLDIIEGALKSARFEMDAVLFRSAMSPVIREQHDEFPMITDPRGRMVVGQFGAYINEMMATWDRGVYPGDVILTSDPFKCSASISHTNDWLVLVPIFYEEELVGWSSQFGHQMDAGGPLPGSLPTGAKTIFEEGIIIPPIKIIERGVPQEDVLRLIFNNVRLPEMNRADLFAIVAGCRAGEKRVIELCDRFGKETYLAGLQALLDRTYEAMRKLIQVAIPEEPQSFEDWIDDDGLGNGPYKMKLTIWREGDHAFFDWSGTDPQALGPINFYLSEGMFKMFIGIYLIMVNDPQILFNDGFYPLLHVVMPEGSLLRPRFPAALGCRTHALARQFDVLGGALVKQAPELNTAAGYGTSPYMLYSGWDAKGEFFYSMEILYGGIPGRPIGDGMDGHSWWPLFENIPTEYLEAYYPLRIDGYTTVTDSGGAGFHRGGNGVEKRYVYLEPGEISIHDDRWLTRPWGVLGGEPGERSEKILRRADGSEERLPSKCDQIGVEPGDMLIYRTAGGGGWKDRLDRPVEDVVRDVSFGLVSREKAKSAYGVVIEGDGAADEAATEAERARQREERGDALPFDFGPPLEETLARCKEETGLDPPVPARPVRWSPLEPGEEALARVRAGDGIPRAGVKHAGFHGRAGFGRRPALLVVDVNLGFTDPASPLVCDLEDVVAAIRRLLAEARSAALPVVYTTVSYAAGDRIAAAAFIDKVPALLTLEAGSRWVDVDPRIAPREGEPVLNKLFASAFFGTPLSSMLAAAGCDSVIVTGASTSGCVRATVVDALQHGYRPLVPREAVGDRNAAAHEANLYDIDAKYGDVVSVDEVVAHLEDSLAHTLAEKIVLSHTNVADVRPGDVVMLRCDLVMANDVSGPVAFRALERMGVDRVFDPDRVVMVADHFTPAKDARSAELQKRLKDWSDAHGVTYYGEGRGGIEHTLLCEEGWIVPGSVIAGGDSHTCTYGALGAFGSGLGSTDIAACLALGEFWQSVPTTIRVEFSGKKRPYVTGKDLILAVLAEIGVGGGTNAVLEFVGEGAAELTVDERLAVANMAVEAGAETGLFPADDVTADYLAGRTERPWRSERSDPDADFARDVAIDLSRLPPLVALPHLPGNVVPVDDAVGTRIDQVYIGNCANGTMTDLRQAAELLRGRRVHPDCRAIVVPATQSIYREALREGLLDVFVEAGAMVSTPTCGACFGGHMGVLGPGERAVATTNRNFRGRMGSGEAEVVLANAYVAAAAAVAGEIVDPGGVA